ncbi:hypothetical protein [Sorangium sp. So ce1182]|uniref:hypothetical protein n=1 Tax=Sorangium sp. So ce1182 TaxID=3133334 RepID=UPI003F5DC0CC
MNERDPELPDFPQELQRAIRAARRVAPSPALERRVFGALEAVEKADSASGRRAPRRLSIPLALAACGGMAAAAALSVCLVGRSEPVELGEHAARDLAVQLPDTGHVVVDLPVDTGRHDDERIQVLFHAPASVALHMEDEAPDDYERECEGHLCVHRWETTPRSEDARPPRVRISEPGRYEFSVIHASTDQRYHERFVVLATR